MSPQLREPVLSRTRRYRMVIGVDLSEYSELVIEHALDQAARHVSPDLHFLVVKEKRKQDGHELQEQLAGRVFPLLETFNRYGTEWRARLHVRAGKPDEQIAGLAADVRADLIVVGSFGLHHGADSLKSTASRVLRDAICPTFVVTMPLAQDASPHCPYCDAVRDDTQGGKWFCDAHAGDRDNITGPLDSRMTTWTGGNLMW